MFKKIFIILIALFIFAQYTGTSYSAGTDSGSSDSYLQEYKDAEKFVLRAKKLEKKNKTERAKKLYSAIVPKTVDEYLSFIEKYPNQKENEKLLNPVWHVHNGKPPKEKIVMPFSMLLNIVGSSNAKSKDVLWKFINRFIFTY